MTGVEVAVVQDGSLALLGATNALADDDQWGFRRDVTALDDIHDLSTTDPCVVVIDPFNGGCSLADIERLTENVRLLVLSEAVSVDNARLALRHGARGVLSKHVKVSTLVAAVRVLCVGGLYFDSALDDALLRPDTGADTTESLAGLLTPREREVLAMVAKGYTHKQIGTRLRLSKATVDTYVHRVRQKTGSVNKAGLTRVAIRLNLLDGPA